MQRSTVVGRGEVPVSGCHKPEVPAGVQVIAAARELIRCRLDLEKGVRGLESPSTESDRILARAMMERLDVAWWRLSAAVAAHEEGL